MPEGFPGGNMEERDKNRAYPLRMRPEVSEGSGTLQAFYQILA